MSRRWARWERCQAGDAIGIRGRPTVPGVKAALARYGLDVRFVHIGLALARPADRSALAKQHADNETYLKQVLTDGGDALLGELHQKAGGQVEEKMVDGACCVRITRYVDEIAAGTSAVRSIVVLSKDIDLTPAVDYAVEMKVPITVAALDVVQHRKHPFVLLGPRAYSQIIGSTLTTGHELRELLSCALYDGTVVPWTVRGTPGQPRLHHSSGIAAVPEPGTKLPGLGNTAHLYPINVTWIEHMLGSFPILICGDSRATTPSWETGTVRRRTAPMTIEVALDNGTARREHFPLGGAVRGDRVLLHRQSGRVLGRLIHGVPQRVFQPDLPQVVRIVSPLPHGGALAVDSDGRRGLLTTDQQLQAGQRLPAIQIDVKSQGLVWSAIGTPIT